MSADWMAWFYRLFWGPNLHHGYYDRAGLSPQEAMQNLKLLLAERANITGNEEVLEVGFGFGESAMWLARMGCRVTAITISRAEQRIATLTARMRGLGGRAHFRILDAADLTVLPGQSYDRIWCLECAEFLPNKPKLLRDWHRLLRPRGRVVFCGLMKADKTTPEDDARYIEPLSVGFSFPPFVSLGDHERWLKEAGFVEVTKEDLTREVLPTGDRGERILTRPDVRLLCRLAPAGIRQNLYTFPRVFEAYRHGALRYGLLAATKP